MADRISPEKRSELMSRVRGKDTRPEMIVRRTVYGLGYRYRLHDKRLPGKPDLVFPGRRRVIFMHGCFWHRHDCARATMPKSNSEYWILKFERNVMRDAAVLRALQESGWRALVIWECDTKDRDLLVRKLQSFLNVG